MGLKKLTQMGNHGVRSQETGDRRQETGCSLGATTGGLPLRTAICRGSA